MTEFQAQRTLTARKPHKCFLCGADISTGEKYVRYSGKYDGDFFDQCFHTDCIYLLDKFCREQQDEEYSPDWVADWISDRVCYSCGEKEDCEENCFRCEKVLEQIAGPKEDKT